jgi:hypothetical protein
VSVGRVGLMGQVGRLGLVGLLGEEAVEIDTALSLAAGSGDPRRARQMPLAERALFRIPDSANFTRL